VQYGSKQARTTRTPPLETLEDLAAAIGDLRRRTELAGRDPQELEIQVESGASGVLLTGDSLTEHRAHLEALAEVGVTQFLFDTPTDSPASALTALARYAEDVMAPLGASA
jgi:hypothetical protein